MSISRTHPVVGECVTDQVIKKYGSYRDLCRDLGVSNVTVKKMRIVKNYILLDY